MTPTQPPAPTGAAVLTWNAVSSSSITGYRVYYGSSSGSYQQSIGSGIKTGTTPTFSVTGLKPGTLYYFAVTAVDNAGNESAYSNEVSKLIQ